MRESDWQKRLCNAGFRLTNSREIIINILRDTDKHLSAEEVYVKSFACGSAITVLIKGKSIQEVLKISPNSLMNYLGALPRDGIHCTILSVCTLHKAIADYLLKTG